MMTTEQFDRETRYTSALAAARKMLSGGIIDGKDYCKIDTILRRKYQPVIGNLLAVNIPKIP